MPKAKTKKAAAKRLKVRKSGSISHGGAGNRHNTGKRSAKRGRRLRRTKNIGKQDMANAMRTLPYRNKSR